MAARRKFHSESKTFVQHAMVASADRAQIPKSASLVLEAEYRLFDKAIFTCKCHVVNVEEKEPGLNHHVAHARELESLENNYGRN